jgi:tetraacyldisaccharide 4'-kinase
MGADIAGWRDFPDHHVYSARELRDLQTEAAQKQAALVTTEKDFVRIAPLLGKLDPSLPVPQSLPVELVFCDPAALDDLLRKALSAARRRISLAV